MFDYFCLDVFSDHGYIQGAELDAFFQRALAKCGMEVKSRDTDQSAAFINQQGAPK